jgi:hypothetical protein
MTTVADRGRVSPGSWGQLLTAVGLAGDGAGPQWVVDSPGCWTLTNIEVWSGVVMTPVISHPRGPTRNRLTSLVSGSATSIWLLPMRSYPRLARFCEELETSVWIQRRPSRSTQIPSGDPKMSLPSGVVTSSVYCGSPQSIHRSHRKVVPTPEASSRILTMLPYGLLGVADSGGFSPVREPLGTPPDEPLVIVR